MTVVRMPLQSDEAQAAVLQQTEWLRGLEQPLHLFLDRIARISIEIQPDDHQALERRCLGEWLRERIELQLLPN